MYHRDKFPVIIPYWHTVTVVIRAFLIPPTASADQVSAKIKQLIKPVNEFIIAFEWAEVGWPSSSSFIYDNLHKVAGLR